MLEGPFAVMVVGAFVIVGLIIYGIIVKPENKEDCYNNCIHFHHGECTMYGRGHKATSPCEEYLEYIKEK